MAIEKIKAGLYAEYEAKIKEVCSLCAEGSNADVEQALTDLKKVESDFRKVVEKEVFAQCESVHDALVKHHFQTISHKKTTDDNGVMTGVEKADKSVTIDLKKFCEYRGFDMGWYFEMQALNKRLTLKACTELGMSKDEIRKIDGSYCMDKLAKDIDLGKTPTSNTQCVKHVQTVLDMLSDGEGRVNSHDLSYIWMCYGKKSNKAALRVVCSKHNILMGLLTDVFHRVATNGAYGVDCKLDEQEVSETAPVVVEAEPAA